MLHGSCLCGAVKLTYSAHLKELVVCHCKDCQKANGTAYAVVSPIRQDLTKFEGEAFIQEYRSTPKKVRAHCRQCASPLYSAHTDAPNTLRLRVGILDTPVSGLPVRHIFEESKPDWTSDIEKGL